MANNKLQPHSLLIIAVRNFQSLSDCSFVSAFELIFILKLYKTVKCIFQNTKTTIGIHFSVHSAQ